MPSNIFSTSGFRVPTTGAIMLSLSIGLSACGGGGDITTDSKVNVSNDANSTQLQAKTTLDAQSAGVPSVVPELTDAVFASTSFWYSALPVNAPLHANSAGFVADFL
ncbi:MAG: hypothetical protein ABI656_10180, partial [bacterium]